MNRKACKKLRRAAESMSVGQPRKQYYVHQGREYRLTAQCTRGIYKQMKRYAA